MATWGEYYHEIASGMALYRETNRRLAELAGLKPGMSVVDLACGSGLTALAALQEAPEGLRLYLVDQSPSMIEAARQRLGDRVTAYILADAAEAPAQIPEQVDRVLCNMSFWYFPSPEAVLKAWRPAILPLGRLCFNLSGTYFNTGGGVVTPQWAFQRELHLRGLAARDINDPERQPNQRALEATLLTNAFKPFHFEVQEVAANAPETEPGGELYNLLRLFPAVQATERQAAVQQSLAAARELAGAIEAWQPRWRAAHFMAQPAMSPEEAIQLKFGGKLPR